MTISGHLLLILGLLLTDVMAEMILVLAFALVMTTESLLTSLNFTAVKSAPTFVACKWHE